ncbi:hypothetical protein ABI011_14785, partial [Enterococcus faecium]|uniref:hypothetical protein n=1 Tax=Enterococcus faecium TaxID=1352 RepID=UPI003F4411FF
MLTLAQVAQRVNDILKESPSKANQPVFLRIKRSKRTTEYVPVMYVCGGTLGIGDLNVTEFT